MTSPQVPTPEQPDDNLEHDSEDASDVAEEDEFDQDPEDPEEDLSLADRMRGLASVVVLTARAAPLAVALTLVGALVDAGLPLLTTWFAARTTTALTQVWSGRAGSLREVFIFIGLTAGTGMLTVLWSSVGMYVKEKLTFVVEARVSDQMLARFAALDYWRYEDKATGDLYDRASRFSKGFAGAFDKIAGVAGALVATISAIVALVLVNPWLALAVAAALVPGIWLQFRLTRSQFAHWNSTVVIRRRKMGIEQRMLHPRAIVELRLFGLVRHLLDVRSGLRDRDQRERLDMERSYILKRLIADVAEAATEFGALVWVTLQIAARTQPVGQFVFVQQVVSRAIESANEFITSLADVDQDVVNVFDYQRFLAIEPERPRPLAAPNLSSGLHLEAVSFAYPGPERPLVLDDVTLDIPAGRHVAIVGENGAGKTTLVKLVLGLFDPSAGRITVDGSDLAEVDLDSWHRQIAVLRQDFAKFSFATVRDNVAWGDPTRPVTDEAVWAALEAAEASEFVRRLPRGLDTFVDPWLDDEEGEVGSDLSGGQWQRLALARSFYRDARILVLDEPTSAIDARAEAAIFERLSADHSRTLVTVSHRLTSVAQADLIHVLVDGRLVESGTHQDLVDRGGHYVRLFSSQLQLPTAPRQGSLLPQEGRRE